MSQLSEIPQADPFWRVEDRVIGEAEIERRTDGNECEREQAEDEGRREGYARSKTRTTQPSSGQHGTVILSRYSDEGSRRGGRACFRPEILRGVPLRMTVARRVAGLFRFPPLHPPHHMLQSPLAGIARHLIQHLLRIAARPYNTSATPRSSSVIRYPCTGMRVRTCLEFLRIS